jgi:hypothetical protein
VLLVKTVVFTTVFLLSKKLAVANFLIFLFFFKRVNMNHAVLDSSYLGYW